MTVFTPPLKNPYPAQGWGTITGFRYASDLHLTRLALPYALDVPRETQYIVARDYRVEVTLDGRGRLAITVPTGMLTDLASVPAFARGIVGRVGPHLEAAVVHDFLYCAWRDLPGVEPTADMHRFADAVMLAGMREAQMGLRATLIYWALRLFGRWAFFSAGTTPRYVNLSLVPRGAAGTAQLASEPTG